MQMTIRRPTLQTQLEPHVISDSAFKRDGNNAATAIFWDACGMCLEIPVEHPNHKIQHAGQKALSLLASSCEVSTINDTSDLLHKEVGRAAWDEISRMLNDAAAVAERSAVNSSGQPVRQMMSGGGRFVYVVSALDSPKSICKIGIATSPEKRISQLSTSSPHALRLEFAIYSEQASEVEKAAHSYFGSQRRNGEWFAISPDLAIDYIVKLTRRES